VKAISEHALGWTDKQIRCVFEFFDSDKSGSIDFDEFIFGVRGQLNERRTQIVLQAFEVRKSWIE
jgi:calcyphosin